MELSGAGTEPTAEGAAPPSWRAPRALTDLSPGEINDLVRALGEKPFRAKQLLRRAWKTHAGSFEEMTELPKGLRRRLERELRARALDEAGELASPDGLTVKKLHRTWDGHEIESVWMEVPAGTSSRRRLTVCLSSQIGCAFGCAFCASGEGGLVRSLRAAEIAEQALARSRERATHVVVMGMGEPLSNYDEVMRAIRILNAPWGVGIGVRRFTVSTIGLLGGIRRLSEEGLELELAISLHAPNDAIRKQLCPRAPSKVGDLISAARGYSRRTGRLVTFEYVLASGVNDSLAHAHELALRLRGLPAKVNLIPLNPVEGKGSVPPPASEVRRFLEELARASVKATVRRERGVDVKAACGQLRWRRPGADGHPA